MASQRSNNPGQTQMTRELDDQNQPSNQGQANFLQETGTQVKNMAHGAAEVGKGAALGAASLAHGAAMGAATVAQGAADAIKTTFGMNESNAAGTNNPNSNASNMGGSTHPNFDMDGSTHQARPSYPHNPDARNF